MSSMQARAWPRAARANRRAHPRKREAFEWYRTELGGAEGVFLNAEPQGTRNVYWMVTAVVSPKLGVTKADLMARLAAEGMDSRPFFHPLSGMPAYESLPTARTARERNVNSYAIAPYSINLPSSLSLTREQARRVSEVFLKRSDRGVP